MSSSSLPVYRHDKALGSSTAVSYLSCCGLLDPEIRLDHLTTPAMVIPSASQHHVEQYKSPQIESLPLTRDPLNREPDVDKLINR